MLNRLIREAKASCRAYGHIMSPRVLRWKEGKAKGAVAVCQTCGAEVSVGNTHISNVVGPGTITGKAVKTFCPYSKPKEERLW